MLPLEELKQLDAQVEEAPDVATLKPIFDRLLEIARLNAGDFEVQIAVADVRQRVIDKGVLLRRPRPNGNTPALFTGSAPPEPPLRRSAPAPVPAPQPVPIDPVNMLERPKTPGPPEPHAVRRAVWIGAVLGITAWLILFVVLVQIARNRNMPPAPKPVAAAKPAPGSVAVDISTTPPGAKIRINGEDKCVSNCRVNLLPGNYQVTALMDGFNPGATGVTVVPGTPINVSLPLVSQGQTVKLYTDLEGGKVVLDGQPARDLQDGQLVLERVPFGKHTVRIAGKLGETSFAFEGESGKQPAVIGPILASNVLAILVTSLGDQARVQSSSPAPLQVALNNQTMGDTGTLGLDLRYVPAGDQTLVLGNGPEQRKLVVSFGPMPSITAFLKADVNTGTLVVSTGEDDVSVFLNGKEYRRKTKRGELRIQTVGNLSVRVAKPGFEKQPDQTIEVKKGEETRLAFKLRPIPRVASLQVRNAVPGTQIAVGDRLLGRVGPDGALAATNIPPGDLEIEARREGSVAKRISRTFKPGETLVVNGSEIALSPAMGTLHVSATPPDAAVTYRRADETQFQPVRESSLRLEPGAYVFVARAPNFLERTERTTVAAGENRTLELTLARETRPTPAPPVPKTATNVRSADWNGWSREGGEFLRKGGNRVVVQSAQSPGTVTFTARLMKGGNLFRNGRLRWFVEAGGDYSQFEIERRKFSVKGPGGSRSRDLKGLDEEGEKTYTIQIDISPDRIVHRMKIGPSWITVDSQPNRGAGDSSFGFVIPGGDEVAVSDFRFTPK